MTERCADLDEFFDRELAADQADRFRDHLATCERCQEVLHGRMQERVAAQIPAARPERAAAPAAEAPRRVASTSGAAPAMAAGATAAAPADRMAPEAAPAPVALPMVATEPRRARGRGRFVVYAAPILAAAAAVPLWLGHRSEPEFELSLAIERASATERGVEAAVPRRGPAAHTGDVLRPRVQGERHQAIWVYLDERELILRCPEDARCRSADGELALELVLTTRGNYAIIAAGSSGSLPAPGPTLDRTLAAARIAGVRTRVEYVDVD